MKNIILTLVLICIFYIVLTMNLYFILDVKHLNIKYDKPEEKTEVLANLELFKKRDIEKFRGKKLIALTFDDGPNGRVTKKIVEGLNERDARATFFMVGNVVIREPEIVKLVYDSGNEIGNHSYSHCYLTRLNTYSLNKQIDKTDTEIEKITGEKPKLLRPPYGSYNKKVLLASNKSLILWNVDPADWKYKNSNSIYNHIIAHAKDGNIIILHDLFETSADGVLRAIDYLKEKGFEFVTISEMAKLKNYVLEQNTVYYDFR